MKAIIEITLKDGTIKTIYKMCANKDEAQKYISNFKGSHFIGYTEDGEFAVVVI